MTSLMDSYETLKRNVLLLILVLMALAGMIATVLHSFEPKVYPLSLINPPLSVIVSLSLFVYLLKHPKQINRVTKLTLAWLSYVLIVPEYYFVMEAVLHPEKRLVDILPPITSGLFLLTTGMIVMLRPRGLVRLVFLLWVAIASPIIIYLIFHPQELSTPRGMDLMMSLGPSMAINFCLILFYSRLQDVIDKLRIEKFHFKEASERDALTNAFNRGAGERILQDLMAQSDQKIGIILCDIDRFKQVNDNYGHLVGDRVLQVIAQCCQNHLRHQDTLIRWGGEEFLIVARGDDEADLEHLAERLRRVIANQQIPEVGYVTASFGVAILQSQETRIELFARADQALYRAKKLGRNQVVLA